MATKTFYYLLMRRNSNKNYYINTDTNIPINKNLGLADIFGFYEFYRNKNENMITITNRN